MAIHVYGLLLQPRGELIVQAPPTGTSIVPAQAGSREVALRALTVYLRSV